MPRSRLPNCSVLGLAYKPNIDDDRASPSCEPIRLLREKGAHVDYGDPHFPEARKGRKHDVALRSTPLTAEAFARHDAPVVSTAHREFRDLDLYRDGDPVVDTRHIVAADPVNGPRRVVRA